MRYLDCLPPRSPRSAAFATLRSNNVSGKTVPLVTLMITPLFLCATRKSFGPINVMSIAFVIPSTTVSIFKVGS
jgi:hypothetical protein